MQLDRFRGEICGVGTASGTRAVIGRWPISPFGSFADAMVEAADGRRVFIAPDDVIGEYVTSIYAFDELVVAPVTCERAPGRLGFDGGPLHLDVGIGRRDLLGWALHALPRSLSTSAPFVTAIDPIARLLMPGVRTRGTTRGGTELYAATDRHRLTKVTASWEGTDLGQLRDVDPPVRFGFSSTPRRASIVAVTTTVRRHGPPPSPGAP